MGLPFDGAISKYFNETAPNAVRKTIREANKKDILWKGYPYRQEIKGKGLRGPDGRSCRSSWCGCKRMSKPPASALS